jgi:hypothetical protein
VEEGFKSSGEYHLSLGNETKLQVRKFKGDVYVDIRKFHDGKPTLKGLSMKPDLFERVFVTWNSRIQEAFKVLKPSCKPSDAVPEGLAGEKVRRDAEGWLVFEVQDYYQVKVYQFKGKPLVDVRNFFKGNPTKKGISLSPETFGKVSEWLEKEDWRAIVQKVQRAM